MDTWAIGVIAYEMLTGCFPFKTRNMAVITKKICYGQLKFDGFDLSMSAISFLKKLLDKNP